MMRIPLDIQYVVLPAAVLLTACSPEPTPSSWLQEPEVEKSTPSARPAVSDRIEIPWLPKTVKQWRGDLIRAGKKHGVEPELLAIVTVVESGGYRLAKSRSGALGLMQLMPATAEEVATLQGIKDHDQKRLFKAEYNLDLGAWYLARQLDAFRTETVTESVERAAAAYNGGPNALRRHLRDAGTMSAQTIRYRYWVRNMWQERHQSDSPTYREWLAAGGKRLIRLAEAELP